MCMNTADVERANELAYNQDTTYLGNTIALSRSSESIGNRISRIEQRQNNYNTQVRSTVGQKSTDR